MGADDLVGDEQPQPQAGARLAALGALELAEDALQVLRADALALVAHEDAHALAVDHPERDVHRLAAGVAQRVGQQVGQHLLDAEVVPHADDGRRPAEAQLAAMRRHLRREGLDHPRHQLAEVDPAGADRQLAGADARHVEHVVDQADQALNLPLVLFHHLLQALLAERLEMLARHLQLAQLHLEDQGVQRGLELVRDDRHEVIAHAHRLLQLGLGAAQFVEQHLLLAAALFQRLELAVQALAVEIQVDEHVDLAAHRVGIERLVHEVHRAALVALEGIVELAPGGADEDDGNVLGALGATHQLGQLETVHARHLHVENGQRELVAQQQFQRLFGRLGLVHLEPRGLQQRVERQEVLRQVVDDQQVRFIGVVGHGRHSRARSSSAMPRKGKR